MNKGLIILLFLLICVQDLLGQRHVYRIDWKGDSIGYLVAEKTKSGSLVRYELKSRTKFSFMLSFDMYTEYYTVFKNGQLLSASTENTVNDKRKSHSSVKLLEEMYHISVDDEERKEKLDIPESIATLYFTPPADEQIFSERHGVFCAVENEKGSIYTLIKPDNRHNLYYYENGICTKVEVNLALATIHMSKIN